MSAPAPSVYSLEAKRIAEKLALKMGKANLDVFADTVLKLAQADKNILAVTSDSRGSGKLKPMGDTLPQQIVEVGIAEQNLVGVAAGLASMGKKVFAVSPACFVTARSLEQIKNDICYSNNPVVVVGISAGVSYGALGTTHHSLHDLAVLRAINNIEIIVPADNVETQHAVEYAIHSHKPVYLRFGKAPLYTLENTPSQSGAFKSGTAKVLRAGDDLAIIACGETVIHGLLAAEKLHEQYGLNCRVISSPFIKPLDRNVIIQSAQECQGMLTIEEHLEHGGLGDACASLLMQQGISIPFKIMAIPDEYTVTGSQADIFRHYGLTMEGVVEQAVSLLSSRGILK